MNWALLNARRLGLSACTESGPMGEKLYAKMGFERVGVWRVPVPGVGHVEMPVLRNSAP